MNFNVVLFEPLIPQNTGSIARLCVGANATLHLIVPINFDLSEKAVRRAGLDYWPFLKLLMHKDYAAFRETVPATSNLWFVSKFGKRGIYEPKYKAEDYFVFGIKTTGLPDTIHKSEKPEQFIKIPMFSENIRCLNLANAASVVLYEAIRQNL